MFLYYSSIYKNVFILIKRTIFQDISLWIHPLVIKRIKGRKPVAPVLAKHFVQKVFLYGYKCILAFSLAIVPILCNIREYIFYTFIITAGLERKSFEKHQLEQITHTPYITYALLSAIDCFRWHLLWKTHKNRIILFSRGDEREINNLYYNIPLVFINEDIHVIYISMDQFLRMYVVESLQDLRGYLVNLTCGEWFLVLEVVHEIHTFEILKY